MKMKRGQLKFRIRDQACGLCRKPDHNRRTCWKRTRGQLFFVFS